MARRIGGILTIQVDGERFQAKGHFDYLINATKKEMVSGMDGIHGYKEVPQVPYIEGAITDSEEIDLKQVQNLRDASVYLDLANGKTIVLREAVYAHEGAVNTEEGEIPFRFEGLDGEEIK